MPVVSATDAGHPAERWQRLLVDFAVIGSTAFGGGTATLLAIRRLCVQRRGWMSDQEYTDCFVLSRLSPGINILAQVILIGRSVAGWRGSVAAVAGLLCPSAVITVLLSTGYVALRDAAGAAGVLAGLSAVVAGLTVGLCLELARGVIGKTSWPRDLTLLLLIVAAAVMGAHPVLLVVASALLGLAFPALLAIPLDPKESADEP